MPETSRRSMRAVDQSAADRRMRKALSGGGTPAAHGESRERRRSSAFDSLLPPPSRHITLIGKKLQRRGRSTSNAAIPSRGESTGPLFSPCNRVLLCIYSCLLGGIIASG